MAKDSKVRLLTVRTPTFLGLTDPKHGLFKKTNGTNSIIGIVDTGGYHYIMLATLRAKVAGSFCIAFPQNSPCALQCCTHLMLCHTHPLHLRHIPSGIWPESPSFSDKGYGKIPKKFKGKCDKGNDKTFKCNK